MFRLLTSLLGSRRGTGPGTGPSMDDEDQEMANKTPKRRMTTPPLYTSPLVKPY